MILSRVANDRDRDQIFGLDCQQQAIPIDFWLNRPQQHEREISMTSRIFNSTMLLELIN